ncbi:TPA_asm: P [Glycyrrhiza betacytorhabdovirus 1]|nr:TPA_asm: P [Glycyrrhiza betacytorhabdovirus 1]
MSFENIVGKGLSNRVNCFFDNGTAPLFLKDPYTTPDSELPIVQAYSGLSRNQRRKYKNWAFDPSLTRQRMAAAQKMLSEKLNQSELKDTTSLMENIMESLKGEYIPKSQTHFEIPGSAIALVREETADPLPVENLPKIDTEKWADVADEECEDNEEEENLLQVENDLKEQVIDEAAKQISQIETASRNLKQEWVPKGRKVGNRKVSLSPPGSKKGNYNSKKRNMSYSPQHKSPSSVGEYLDIGEVECAVKSSFYEHNVNLTREFKDDLIRLFNDFGFLTQEMITMYLAGIKKERQVSLSVKQENIITQLANTAAAFGKHLDSFQKNLVVQNEMTSHMISAGSLVGKGNIAPPLRQTAPVQIARSSVINPPPVREAPKKQVHALEHRTSQYQTATTSPAQAAKGIVISEPTEQSQKRREDETVQGKGKEKMKEYRSRDIIDVALAALSHISFPIESMPDDTTTKLITMMGIDYWFLVEKADSSEEKGKLCNDITELAISLL